MKDRVERASVGFLLGVAAGNAWAVARGDCLPWLGLVAGVSVWFVLCQWRVAALGLLLGLAWTLFREPTMPLPSDGKERAFSGTVLSVSEGAGGRTAILESRCQGGIWARRYRISAQDPRLQPGRRVEGRGVLRAFRRAHFPGEFSAWQFYRQRGLCGEWTRVVWEKIEGAPRPPGLRERVLAGAQRRLSAFPETSRRFLQRLFLAEREADTPLETQMKALGVAHLLAVSGLHISLFFSLGLFLLAHLGCPRRWADVLLLGLLAGYGALLSWPPSVARALFFLLFRELAQGLQLRLDRKKRWLLSLCAYLGYKPYALFDPGLHLSFVCSLALETPAGVLSKSLRLQWFTLPIQWRVFGQVPLSILLANAVAIPAFTPFFFLALAAFSFADLPGLGELSRLLFLGAESLFRALLAGLQALSLPVLTRPGGLRREEWALYGVLSLLWVAWREDWLRELAYPSHAVLLAQQRFEVKKLRAAWVAVAWTSLFSLGLFSLPSPALFTMLDVDQGDALLLQTKEQTWLFDTGGRRSWRTGEDLQGPLMVEKLKRRGVTRLDRIFISHRDTDHCGNLAAIVAAFPVGEIVAGDRFSLPLPAAVPVCAARRGQRWTMPSAEVEVLRTGPFDSPTSNEDSLCLLLDFGVRILLTGDAERVEDELLQALRGRRVDVLKVAHHGSRGGTSARFLEALQPRLALLSCGENNAYGHPHPSVLARLENAGIACRRTDQVGDCTLWREGAMLRTGKKHPHDAEWQIAGGLALLYGFFLYRFRRMH